MTPGKEPFAATLWFKKQPGAPGTRHRLVFGDHDIIVELDALQTIPPAYMIARVVASQSPRFAPGDLLRLRWGAGVPQPGDFNLTGSKQTPAAKPPPIARVDPRYLHITPVRVIWLPIPLPVEVATTDAACFSRDRGELIPMTPVQRCTCGYALVPPAEPETAAVRICQACQLWHYFAPLTGRN